MWKSVITQPPPYARYGTLCFMTIAFLWYPQLGDKGKVFFRRGLDLPALIFALT